MDKYRWRVGSGFRGPATPVVRHLKQLQTRHNGTMTPAVVLEDAGSRASPLYDHFEWADRTAAHAYRLWQARRLIGSLMVVSESAGVAYQEVPAFAEFVGDEDKDGK